MLVTFDTDNPGDCKMALDLLTRLGSAQVPSHSDRNEDNLLADDHLAFGELPARVINALEEYGVDNLEKLSKLSTLDLMKLPNIGKLSLREIKKVLAGRGLSLNDTKKTI